MCTVPSWKGGVRSDDFAHTFERSLESSEDFEEGNPLINPNGHPDKIRREIDDRRKGLNNESV